MRPNLLRNDWSAWDVTECSQLGPAATKEDMVAYNAFQRRMLEDEFGDYDPSRPDDVVRSFIEASWIGWLDQAGEEY